MTVDTGINEAGIFVAFELEDSIVHQRSIEYPKSAEHVEIGYTEACNFLEETRFKLCNNILQTALTVICEVHEDRYACGKLNEFLLDLLTLAFDFFLLFA